MYPYRKKLYKFLFIIFIVLILLTSILVFVNSSGVFKGLGFKKLKSGEEITVEVKPKLEQVDYNSKLRIENKDGIKLKIITGSSKELWHELSTDTFYNTITKQKYKKEVINNKIQNKVLSIDETDGVSFDENHNFIIDFKGEKTFDVTNNKNYTIKIKNVSNYSGKISISVENT